MPNKTMKGLLHNALGKLNSGVFRSLLSLLRTGIMQCKPVKDSHVELLQNLCMDL
jgi:hypothetical protein